MPEEQDNEENKMGFWTWIIRKMFMKPRVQPVELEKQGHETKVQIGQQSNIGWCKWLFRKLFMRPIVQGERHKSPGFWVYLFRFLLMIRVIREQPVELQQKETKVPQGQQNNSGWCTWLFRAIGAGFWVKLFQLIFTHRIPVQHAQMD